MLNNKIALLPKIPTVHQNRMRISFLAQSEAEKSEKEYFYELPNEYANAVTDYAILMQAMQSKQDIYIKGKVSLALLRNLKDFQLAWSQWMPKVFSKVTITAEKIVDKLQIGKNAGGIVAFSGGVDACFVLWDNLVNPNNAYKHDIKASVMVHGFDIKLDNQNGFDEAYQKAKKITDSLEIPLISMKTNLRYEPWYHVHGAAIASCLTLLSGKYNTGLIASSDTYGELNASHCGSNYITDQLLSNQDMSFVYHGAGYSRIEKEDKLGTWEVATQNLRVCWQSQSADNCGKCEKCLRTMLGFRLKGHTKLACFPQDITNQQIRSLWIASPYISELKDILVVAKRENIKAAWLDALRFCVYKSMVISAVKSILFGKKAAPIWLKNFFSNLV